MAGRSVRVTLSASVSGFVHGINQARNTFGGFVRFVTGGIGSLGKGFLDLTRNLFFVREAFETVAGAARTLFDTFVSGAISAEMFHAQLKTIADTEEDAAAMMQIMEDRALEMGMSFDELAMSGTQVARAIRGANGSVDLELWQGYLEVINALGEARPDVPKDFWGRAISAFMSGETRSLEMMLDLNLENEALMGRLSAETRAFLQAGKQATDQQLGAVTRLGTEAGAKAGDALKALKELLAVYGISEETIEAFNNTTAGQLAELRANWEFFTRKVGEAFLPALSRALGSFLKILEDNRPAIEDFATKLGEWAAVNFDKLIEFLFNKDWEKIGQDIAATAKSIGDFVTNPQTKETLMDLAEALKNIGDIVKDKVLEEGFRAMQDLDWEEIAQSVSDLAEGVRYLTDSAKAFDSSPIGEFFGAMVETINDAVTGMQALIGMMREAGMLEAETTPQYTVGNPPPKPRTPPPPNGNEVQMGGYGNNGNQRVEVDVNVSVDDDGKIIATARKTAAEAVGELVKATVGKDRVGGAGIAGSR